MKPNAEKRRVSSTSSLEGFAITDGSKSGLMIGSTSAVGVLADGVLDPNNRATETTTK